MLNTFRKKGGTAHDMFNLYDEIFEETVHNVNENNKEML